MPAFLLTPLLSITLPMLLMMPRGALGSPEELQACEESTPVSITATLTDRNHIIWKCLSVEGRAVILERHRGVRASIGATIQAINMVSETANIESIQEINEATWNNETTSSSPEPQILTINDLLITDLNQYQGTEPFNSLAEVAQGEGVGHLAEALWGVAFASNEGYYPPDESTNYFSIPLNSNNILFWWRQSQDREGIYLTTPNTITCLASAMLDILENRDNWNDALQDVNILSNINRTPLFYAIRYYENEIAQRLVGHVWHADTSNCLHAAVLCTGQKLQ